MLLSAGPALAQTQEAPPASVGPTGQLQEVVVTAQFRTENIQQTPLAISAISAAALEERGQTSVTQIASQVPSVYLTPATTAFGPSMNAFIRGIGQYDQDPALEPGVGIYVDDVYFGTITGALLDLLDLDRVEVLRGPQGTLEGMNSEGGAIKLFSKLPDATPSTTFDALFGSRNHIELRASTDFALADNLFVRIAGVGNFQDGYEHVLDFGCANRSFAATDINGHQGTFTVSPGFTTKANSCEIGQQGGTGYEGARVSIRWVINDHLEALVVGDMTNQNQENAAETLLGAQPPIAQDAIALPATNITNPSNPTPALLPYDSTRVPAMIPSNPYNTYGSLCLPAVPQTGQPQQCGQNRTTLRSWGAQAAVTWTINDTLQLKNIVAERAFSSTWYEDNDDSPWPLGLGAEALDHHQFSEELRLNGSVPQLLDWTIGGFYFSERSVYASQQDLWYTGGPLMALDFLQDDPITAHDRAGYLHTVWHLTPKLDLTAAARYTSQDKDYTYVRLSPDLTPAPRLGALNGLTAHYQASRIDYRGNLAYRFTDQLMAYGQVSTGFKGGGVDPRPFNAAQAVKFDPENLLTYEAGIKSTWLDRRLRVNIDGYFSRYNQIQLTLNDCSAVVGPDNGVPCALPYNAGDAHETGVEVESQLRLGGLQVDLSGSWLNFNYTSLFVEGTGVHPGMITPFTPKLQGSAGVQYTVPTPAGSLTARVDASARSQVYSGAVNADLNRIAGFTTYNARLTWDSPKSDWQIALQALNLTNKLYYLNIFDLAAAGGGSIGGNPAAPRELDIEIKHKL